MLKLYTFKCPNVQANSKEDAKRYLNEVLKRYVLHPDGVSLGEVEEVKEV